MPRFERSVYEDRTEVWDVESSSRRGFCAGYDGGNMRDSRATAAKAARRMPTTANEDAMEKGMLLE